MKGIQVRQPLGAIVIVLLLLAVGGSVLAASFALGGEDKPKSSPPPEGVEVTPPKGQEPTPSPLPDVAASGQAPSGVVCPADWLYFDNPVMHYSVCYPADWGFSDFSSQERLAQLNGESLYSVNLLSPDYFSPRPAASEEQPASNAVTLTIESFPPGVTRQGCAPETEIDIAGVTAHWCEDTYDVLPGPEVKFSPDGALHTLVTLAPLERSPEVDPVLPESVRNSQPKTGYQLLITVTGPTARYESEGDVQWEIIKTLRLY